MEFYSFYLNYTYKSYDNHYYKLSSETFITNKSWNCTSWQSYYYPYFIKEMLL